MGFAASRRATVGADHVISQKTSLAPSTPETSFFGNVALVFVDSNLQFQLMIRGFVRLGMGRKCSGTGHLNRLGDVLDDQVSEKQGRPDLVGSSRR